MATTSPGRTDRVNLVDYLDKKVDGLRDDLKTQLDKQDIMLERIDNKVNLLDERIGIHASLPGHPLGMLRLENVEHNISGQGERKWKAWQILVAVFGFCIYLCSLSFTALGVFLSVLTLILHIAGH